MNDRPLVTERAREAGAPPEGATWQVAWLRALCAGPGEPHALLGLAGGQCLRVPIDERSWSDGAVAVGRRVWVDPHARPVRLCLRPDLPAQEVRHAL